MLLAVDIGNTHTVLGAFEGDKLLAAHRISSSPSSTSAGARTNLSPFFQQIGATKGTVTAFGISSVVPALTGTFEAMAHDVFGVKAITVSACLDLGMKIFYDDPGTLGADRICNAVAGFQKYGGPLIVIDLGTATTYEVISADGDFLGGVIALGLGSEAEALHSRAAQLPKIALDIPSSAIGRNTAAAMQAGVMIGGIKALEGIIHRIRHELGVRAKVIATGGLAPLVAGHTPLIAVVDEYLVLEGVRLIVERVGPA